MTEPHMVGDVQETRSPRGFERIVADPEPLARSPHQHRVPDRLGGRDK